MKKLIFLLVIFPSVVFSQPNNITIHSDNDSIYIQDSKRQESIILPTGERIKTDDLNKLESNREPLRTREGTTIHRMYDNQYRIEYNKE